MIEITVNKNECAIKFDKDKSRQLAKVKNIRGMKFKGGKWTFSAAHLIDVIDRLDNWDLELIGKLPPAVEKRLDQQEKPMQPFKFKTNPFPHQLKSFEYAKTHNRFLLGDEQGLGKTKQSIDIAVSKKGRVEHCLIVCCVNGLKWNWVDEVAIHSNEKAHILGHRISRTGSNIIDGLSKRHEDLKKQHDEYFLVTNIESLRDKKFCDTLRAQCQDGRIGMVIVDEVHKCKNPTSQQGKALQKLESYYRIALTGTPMMNSPVDLYNVLKWLGVETHTFTAFKEYYCVFGGFGNNEIVGYKHLGELEDLLNSVMLRRKKMDVLDLPPKIRTDVYVDMNTKQSKLYAEALQHIRTNIDKVLLLPNPLVELIRLRQCTSYPGILTSQDVPSSKIDKCLDIIDAAATNGDKVIVFTNWTSVVYPMVELLKAYNPAIITGEEKDTAAQRHKFMEDDSCKVIIGTIKAMGTGYTLTKANTVVFMDEPWTMADKEQAEDRAHRIGTEGTVNIYTLLCKDTIDERIHQIVEDKGQLSAKVVDGIPVPMDSKNLVNFLVN